MNRQLRRMNERQEAKDKETSSQTKSAQATAKMKADRAQRKGPRTGPRKFLRETVSELKKVDWPGREEVTTYTMVVLINVVFVGAAIFGLDYGFGKVIFRFLQG